MRQQRAERRSRCRRCGSVRFEVWGVERNGNGYRVVLCCETCYMNAGLLLPLSEKERLRERGLPVPLEWVKFKWRVVFS